LRDVIICNSNFKRDFKQKKNYYGSNADELGVIIFGLVRFLSKKVTKSKKKNLKKKPKPNRNGVKPTGFGSVF